MTRKESRARWRSRLRAAAGMALLVAHGGCGFDGVEIPELVGPAELATSVTLTASPDIMVADGFSTSLGTAIGNGVLASIDALSRVNPDVAPSTVTLSPAERRRDRFASRYVPDVVVLLTDGAATTGVDPRDAARQAADRRVRVFTIGFGTTTPAPLSCTPQQFGGDTLEPLGGGGVPVDLGVGRRGNFLQIDEATLRGIARTTGGTYARAASASQLDKAFRDLPRRIVTVKEVHELTVYLVALGAVLALGAVMTSRWFNRVG